ALFLPFAKVRLQGLAHAGIERCPELFADRRFVERRSLSETTRQNQSDGPVVQATEQLGVADQELAEVQRDAAVHEIDEHKPTRVLLVDADGQLVGKAADGLRASRAESEVR